MVIKRLDRHSRAAVAVRHVAVVVAPESHWGAIGARGGRASGHEASLRRDGGRVGCDGRPGETVCSHLPRYCVYIAPPMVPIRRNIQELPASRIRAVTLRAKGIDDLIPLWFGEGDDVTPAFIRDAAAAALQRGETFYGPNRGIPELRDAIQRYMRRIYRAEIDLDRVVVSASAMNALMISVQCLVGAGDSAVVIGPVWPNAEQCVAAMGAEVRKVDLQAQPDGAWHLDLDRVIDACDATTRLIVVNSPGNPTGWMASEPELATLLDHARRRGI